MPALLARTLPALVEMVCTVAEADDPPPEAVVVVEEDALGVEEPQAAATRATAPTVASAMPAPFARLRRPAGRGRRLVVSVGLVIGMLLVVGWGRKARGEALVLVRLFPRIRTMGSRCSIKG